MLSKSRTTVSKYCMLFLCNLGTILIVNVKVVKGLGLVKINLPETSNQSLNNNPYGSAYLQKLVLLLANPYNSL